MKKKFYAVKNKNDLVRVNSSSGGVFWELSNWVINNNGVVYGAIYDENLKVKHSRCDNVEGLKAFSGSKYVFSEVSNSYKQIGSDLKNYDYVLFSGTPCQVSAVKKLYDNYSDKLILIDIVCHGTPDVKYYNDYIEYMQKKYNSDVKYINMRFKEQKEFNKNKKSKYVSLNEVSPHVMHLEFQSGKTYSSSSEFDLYYQFFDYFMRKPCFNCKFATMNRISDITIGDFHEFSSKLNNFNDGNGVSLVILNSEKGENLFYAISSNLNYESKNESECIQPALSSPAAKPDNYIEFHSDYSKYGFDYVANKYAASGLKFKIKKFLYKIGIYYNLKKIIKKN